MICKCSGLFNNNFRNFVRRYTSALYITGEKAQKNFVVLTPVVDFDEKLINKDSLRNNIAKRGLGIDIEQIEKKWKFFKSIEERKQHLETTRTEISVAISNLLKISDSKQDDIERLKLHARVVKDDLKNLKDTFYGIEEDTMLKILSLPNDLNEKTPERESVIYSSPNSNIIEKSSKNHIEIAKSNDYIQYLNPSTYYLKSNVALFEISVLNYFRQRLLKSGYVQFSNPSFCRSIIVEGCGETSDVFTVEEESSSKNEINRLHLCGSSNLYPFMAYFARHALQQSRLPLKYFSVGKKYTPVLTESSASLFNLSQEAVLNTFIAVSEEDDILDSIFEEVSKIYEPLGYHYRLTLLPANKLEKSESLRLSIQMYSNYLQSYVEVGNVSLYENYMSKRLLFTYNSNKGKRYPKVVSGTLLNVPKMLGCILKIIP
ncbi:hypothetical protein JTB14_013697 [Gonioctena quinquepunctata]|nr:hypothetical protein JTB14_013697 [Gonioctena quinquepunctata]